MTSGTSGNAAKLFPLTVAAQRARGGYFRVMSARANAKLRAMGADGGVRLGLAVPGLPEETTALVEPGADETTKTTTTTTTTALVEPGADETTTTTTTTTAATTKTTTTTTTADAAT